MHITVILGPRLLSVLARAMLLHIPHAAQGLLGDNRISSTGFFQEKLLALHGGCVRSVRLPLTPLFTLDKFLFRLRHAARAALKGPAPTETPFFAGEIQRDAVGRTLLVPSLIRCCFLDSLLK